MQDRYTGDIGDFAKYGLLRAIRGRKRLGVAWYLHPSGGPEGDGKHIVYLQQDARWRHLDPSLFDVLKRLVGERKRSVGAVQREGLLGRAIFAGERLDIARVAVRQRERWRREWFEGVRNRLSNCDLVFADPDNGVFPDHHFQPRQRDSAKRIPLAEARALAEGRAAVIYHHNTRRRGGHHQEIQWWMGQLTTKSSAVSRDSLSVGVTTAYCCTGSTGGTRWSRLTSRTSTGPCCRRAFGDR